MAYTSRRRSAAKFTAALEPNHAPPTPPPIIKRAVRIISAQVSTIKPTSWFSTPMFSIRLYHRGIITSPSTSTIMQIGASTKYFQ